MIVRPIALAALLAVSGGMAVGQTDVSPPSAEEMEAAMTTAEGFAERAASSNMFEIRSSELALQMSQSDVVRAFAETMIADHTVAGEKMMAVASEAGLTVPTELMPDHQAQLDNLAASAPDAFDQAYIGAQLAAHEEAVMLFQGFAANGEEGALAAFAAETVPTLEEHLGEVQALSTQTDL